MGHRANFVVIRDCVAEAYQDDWAALGCVDFLVDGPESAIEAARGFDSVDELLDWSFAEGGYLIDVDHRLLIVFGQIDDDTNDFLEIEEDDSLSDEELKAKDHEFALKQYQELFDSCSESWRGWTLRWDERGVDAFAMQLKTRGINTIRTAAPSHEVDAEYFETQISE
jgi:hypothetical protein